MTSLSGPRTHSALITWSKRFVNNVDTISAARQIYRNYLCVLSLEPRFWTDLALCSSMSHLQTSHLYGLNPDRLLGCSPWPEVIPLEYKPPGRKLINKQLVLTMTLSDSPPGSGWMVKLQIFGIGQCPLLRSHGFSVRGWISDQSTSQSGWQVEISIPAHGTSLSSHASAVFWVLGPSSH